MGVAEKIGRKLRCATYCVRQRAKEQLATETLGWVAALKVAPALLQGGMIKVVKSRNGLLDARVTHLERRHLGGALARHGLRGRFLDAIATRLVVGFVRH